MRKSVAERTVESLTWALVVIWLGMMLIAGGLQYAWLVMMVLGIILLTSAIYQHLQGWETSYAIWIFGVWMAVFSVVELADELIAAANEGKGLGIDLGVYLGIALISMGVATMLRLIRGAGKGMTSDTLTEGTSPTDYPTAAPTLRPRVVHDQTGTGMYGPSRYRPETPSAPAWDSRPRSVQDTVSRYATAENAYSEYNASRSRYAEEHMPLYGDTEYDAFGEDYDDLLDDPDELPQRRYSRRYTVQRPHPVPPPPQDAEALEARVEDIIQRSRKRRKKMGPEELAEEFRHRAQWSDEGDLEDLPY